jgi:DUF1680 family protein
VHDGFWSPRRKAAIDESIPTVLKLLEEHGEIDNFRRVSGQKNVPHRGRAQTDADVYKWLEAVGFAVQSGDVGPQVRRAAEGVIDCIVAAQEPSGYIFSGFMAGNDAKRHTEMGVWHELYTTGHLLQAGITWYRANGNRKLLDVGIRMVEYLLRHFGPDKKPLFEGHPGIEMALVELYRTVSDRRYLDFAGYFLNGDERNMKEIRPADLVYLFTVSPFTGRTRLEGHAVRAMYACSGATDYFLETGAEKYWNTLATLWDDMVRHKMYITGGLGSRTQGEAIGDPYELPNSQAYAESCAAIGNVLWNWRLLQGTGDAKYTDVMERALYNGVNGGLSLGGRSYCYRNPLEISAEPGDKIRKPWYSVPCCPPNLERMFASLPGYFYSTSKDGVWIHLFDNADMDWKLEDGTPLRVSQQTRYPWDGKVTITLTPPSAKEFTVFVRKPSWSPTVRVAVDGAPLSSPPVWKGYFAIHRAWDPGDRIQLQLSMTPRLVIANPSVRDDIGKVAVERGPLVYAAETLDQPAGTTVFDWQLAVSPDAKKFKSVWKPDMLGGILALAHPAIRPAMPKGEQPLYEYLVPRRYVSGEVTLVPYYTFQNREPTSMAVWIPYREAR